MNLNLTSVLFVLPVLLLAESPAQFQTPRKPNPFAPSLPLLTDAEEEKLDRILERFIEADLGLLRGDEAKKAVAEFNQLGPEAIPALIRGLNRAAAIEHKCPVTLIAKKLSGKLHASNDPELLEFARENIGAGVKANKHKALLNELRVLCATRKAVVARAAPARTPPGKAVSTVGTTAKEPTRMTVAELATSAGSERGPRLKVVLTELGARTGDEAIAALGAAAASYEGEERQLAREQLAKVLGKLTPAALKDKLKDDRAAVRATAARLVGGKALRFGAELIDLLGDSEADVRQAARQALAALSKGVDFGPAKEATPEERAAATKQWRAWWATQKEGR